MKCKSPINKNGLKVPCGCCVACRINDTTDWSIRALYELADYDMASFVTFTYDNEHYPLSGSLEKERFQDYMDNLQHIVKREKGIALRFFDCGEYGTHTQRAHYHGILYGLNPDPFDKNNFDRKIIQESWKYCDPHRFDWNKYKYNENAINFCTRETIQYVAGYIQKKLKSYAGVEEYEKTGREPPFRIMSKQLGLNYAMQNADTLRKNGFCIYNGYKVRIPRYFREKLGIVAEPLTEEEENFLKVKNHMLDFQVQQRWNSYDMRFKAWLRSKGLPYDHIDDFELRDVKERLFNHWYEIQINDLCAQAEREFRAHTKLLTGVI